MQTNHIAILVHDLEAVSQTLPDACIRHEAEEHPAEGTLEQYITIGGDHNPAPLLIQWNDKQIGPLKHFQGRLALGSGLRGTVWRALPVISHGITKGTAQPVED